MSEHKWHFLGIVGYERCERCNAIRWRCGPTMPCPEIPALTSSSDSSEGATPFREIDPGMTIEVSHE